MDKTTRPWGYYNILYENGPQVKLKELTIDPGKILSMQRHSKRAEHWFVVEGVATVYTINRSSDCELLGRYERFSHIHIITNQWHQLANDTDQPLKIIEIQYGEECIEEDIQRQQ